MLVKGVDKSYDWDFFKSNLVQGKIPTYSTEVTSDEILISIES